MRRALPLLLVLAAACTSAPEVPATGETDAGDAEVDESKLPLQPDGPLRGLAMVPGVEIDGFALEPQLRFSTEDTAAAAVVVVGDDAPADGTLSVAWYLLTGIDGRESLFTHRIAVGQGGLAFSEGLAPGGLAPGLYEVVATLEEFQLRTPWVVREPEDPSGVAARAVAAASSGALAQEAEPWETPGAGDSYWWNDGVPPEEPSPPPPGPCEILDVFGGFDPMTAVTGGVGWRGTCSTMAMTATVAGEQVTMFSGPVDPELAPHTGGIADVCAVPGGSDLPGTVVRLAATGSEGASMSLDYALPDRGRALVAEVETEPGDGAHVEPGQSVGIRGLGMVMPPALGISEIAILVNDAPVTGDGNASGSEEPVACDVGRYYAGVTTTYAVPDNPPPIIEVCALVIGFDGTRSRHCARLFTRAVWTGTMDLRLSKDYLAEQSGLKRQACDGTWQVALTFGVADDRSISGTANARLTGGPDCTFDIPGTADSAEFSIAGNASDDAFELRFSLVEIEPPGDFVGLLGAMDLPYVIDLVTPTHAESMVQISTTEAGPFPVTGEARISADCPACTSG
jgi:hypothetical protein